MSNIETQVSSAIAQERKSNRKRESIRALVVVFGVIPLVLVAAVGGWLAAQRMGLI